MMHFGRGIANFGVVGHTTGRSSKHGDKCPNCRGTGQVKPKGPVVYVVPPKCPRCEGKGKI
ncbi:hypothetical protein [Risungbinella massiliensis]|uniref:hypothetical protein n=1 Tax=Risungbinella massiliensis TaxID=1329796 RepID=UPI0005CC5F9C|nr:hypothetical protein [Risungbinella massiliensis]